MRYIFTLLTILLLGSQACFSQSSQRSIVEKDGGHYSYVGEKRLTRNRLAKLASPDLEIGMLIQSSKDNMTIGCFFASVGGVMMGWQIGRMIASREPNLTSGAAGFVLAGLSIPFFVASSKDFKKAIDKYNQGLSAPEDKVSQLQFNFGVSPNGLSLSMNF